MEICPECGGKLVFETRQNEYTNKLGKKKSFIQEGLYCTKCNEGFFDKDSFLKSKEEIDSFVNGV
jgi:YgiT-type zinc finger domain-containing protein